LDSPGIVTPDSRSASGEALSAAAVSERKKLDRSLARNLTWRAAGDWASQLLSWTSLLIVVRLLTPADFGIVAMAVILLPYLKFLGEFGIPRTIVNLRDLSEEQIAQLNTVGLCLGVACFGIAVLLAQPFAIFFRTPALAGVVIVTCLALIPQGLVSVSEGLLSREMRFGLISWFEATRAIVASITTLVLAYFHFGYWALVIGNLLGICVRSFLIVKARPHSYAMPRLSSIREALLFGWHVMVSVVALNSYQRLDNLTAGRVLGQTALGFYGMAWTLANVPIEKVTSLVTTVIPSYLAVVQKDPAALRRYLRGLTEAIALVTFPATIGLGLVAHELIPLALGNRWDGVILPLQILSLYAGFRSVMALVPKVLTAVGDARYVMWNDLAALVVLPIAFFLGSRWGTGGIAWGWVAVYPLVVVPLYRKTFQKIGMRASEYWHALRPAIDGTLAMAAAVLLLKWLLPSRGSLLLALVLKIFVGAIAYVAAVSLLHRPRVVVFLGMLKGFRRRTS
jgi:O-antigen/teichoic acid export membrane protein